MGIYLKKKLRFFSLAGNHGVVKFPFLTIVLLGTFTWDCLWRVGLQVNGWVWVNQSQLKMLRHWSSDKLCNPFKCTNLQGSKLLGFRMSGTPKNGGWNPFLGPEFPTGNPGIVRLTDKYKLVLLGFLTGNPQIAGEIQMPRQDFWMETQILIVISSPVPTHQMYQFFQDESAIDYKAFYYCTLLVNFCDNYESDQLVSNIKILISILYFYFSFIVLGAFFPSKYFICECSSIIL